MSRTDARPILVEEEFLLAQAAAVLPRAWGRGAGFPVAQWVAATSLCGDQDATSDHLARNRARLSGLAERTGGTLAPLGADPWGPDVPHSPAAPPPSDGMEMRVPAPRPVLNGMAVHVGVPDRDTGVAVMNRLRCWVHVLLALGANSPFWHGQDTGFESWRAVLSRTRPASGVPPHLDDAAAYDRQLERIRGMGVLDGDQQVNWMLRLSRRLTGVEVRVADVQLDVRSAVMMAELTRALVDRALRDVTVGVLERCPPTEVVQAACWQAARHGLRDTLVDLGPSTAGSPKPRPAGDVVGDLLGYVRPTAADRLATTVEPAVAAALAGGNGAQQQRRAWRDGGPNALLRLISTSSRAAVVPS